MPTQSPRRRFHVRPQVRGIQNSPLDAPILLLGREQAISLRVDRAMCARLEAEAGVEPGLGGEAGAVCSVPPTTDGAELHGAREV